VQHSNAETQERDDEGLEILEVGLPQADESASNRLRWQTIVWRSLSGRRRLALQRLPLNWKLPALFVAPLGRRFLAGLVDGLVLLLAGGAIRTIFWRAGGRLTPIPPIVVVALIAIIFVYAYFGCHGTHVLQPRPGLDGHCSSKYGRLPTGARESSSAAFCVTLVVALGFHEWVFALVIGLTWHIVSDF